MVDVYLQMIQAYYDNSSFEVFMHPQTHFKIVQTMSSVIGGYTERHHHFGTGAVPAGVEARLEEHDAKV